MKETLNTISNLIHQIQRERGCAALFLGSLGRRFNDEIKRQYQLSDKAIVLFEKQPNNNLIEPSGQQSLWVKINNICQKIDALPNNRTNIDQLKFSASEAINYYTYEIISPLLDIAIELVFFGKTINAQKAIAYTNFLYWKERTGRERAIGMRGFLSDIFDNQEFVERIEFLIKEQESYQKTFMALADRQQSDAVKKIIETPTLQRVEKIHHHMEQTPQSQLLSAMTAEGWYALMTHKIDLMQQVEQALIETLESNQTTQTIISSLPKKESTILTTVSRKHFDFIRCLPLFSTLDEAVLLELLKHAQTKTYHKGKLLFSEGEPINRFYIILDGWVKLFKGVVNGEETIVQMMSSGEVLTESSIFLNAPCPVSGQVAREAILLTFPAPIMRQFVRKHNALAVSMLTNLSLRSQTLIHQVESTRLKSATERVGWFLLKLLLDNNWSMQSLKLPYDKSMIASYLDMTPETFSRTLNTFKKRGFTIKHNVIVVPDIQSLCHYCDIDSAFLCTKQATPQCPNN